MPWASKLNPQCLKSDLSTVLRTRSDVEPGGLYVAVIDFSTRSMKLVIVVYYLQSLWYVDKKDFNAAC